MPPSPPRPLTPACTAYIELSDYIRANAIGGPELESRARPCGCRRRASLSYLRKTVWTRQCAGAGVPASGETVMRINWLRQPPPRFRICLARVSNGTLTASSFRRRLGDHLDGCLRHLVERRQCLGVGLIALLRDDHVGELRGKIHVGLFHRSARNGSVPSHAGFSHHRGS